MRPRDGPARGKSHRQLRPAPAEQRRSRAPDDRPRLAASAAPRRDRARRRTARGAQSVARRRRPVRHRSRRHRSSRRRRRNRRDRRHFRQRPEGTGCRAGRRASGRCGGRDRRQWDSGRPARCGGAPGAGPLLCSRRARWPRCRAGDVARRERAADRVRTAPGHPARSDTAARSARVRAGDDREVRRQDGWSPGGGAEPLRRQSAEIHCRTRDSARAARDDCRTADLGRRHRGLG